jgi:hypothetical protein
VVWTSDSDLGGGTWVCQGREGKQVEEGMEEEREYASFLDFSNIFADVIRNVSLGGVE